jgi:hypothetical protein
MLASLLLIFALALNVLPEPSTGFAAPAAADQVSGP